tara:strand:- start:1936 stop:2124 length:189 start_codon:yes stop_codon:yes gene_type:complete
MKYVAIMKGANFLKEIGPEEFFTDMEAQKWAIKRLKETIPGANVVAVYRIDYVPIGVFYNDK